jgi:hypothetical protein
LTAFAQTALVRCQDSQPCGGGTQYAAVGTGWAAASDGSGAARPPESPSPRPQEEVLGAGDVGFDACDVSRAGIKLADQLLQVGAWWLSGCPPRAQPQSPTGRRWHGYHTRHLAPPGRRVARPPLAFRRPAESFTHLLGNKGGPPRLSPFDGCQTGIRSGLSHSDWPPSGASPVQDVAAPQISNQDGVLGGFAHERWQHQRLPHVLGAGL